MINREWHLLSRPVGWPKPEDFALVESEVPTPGEGQVVVRLHAVGVNPVDTYIRAGAYARVPTLPYVPGAADRNLP